MAKAQRKKKEQVKNVDKTFAEHLSNASGEEITENDVSGAAHTAMAESNDQPPAPLTPGAQKYLDENFKTMRKIFTEESLNDRSSFLGRDLTVEDMEELYGPDTSIPEDAQCGIPNCETGNVAKIAYRAAMVINRQNEERSGGKVGDLMIDRNTDEVVERGIVVAHKQADGTFKPIAFCFRHLQAGRKRPDLPENKRLPAQTWQQAKSKAEALTKLARVARDRKNEEQENISSFYDSVGAKKFNNQPRFDRLRRGSQPVS